MSADLDPSDLLKTEFVSLPLAEVLGRPVTVLLGVDDDAATALAALEIASVFDLAMSRVFTAAVELNDAGENPSSILTRFGAAPADLVAPGLPATSKVADLRLQPVGVLAGVSDPAALQHALGVATVRDLAVWPPFRAATTILRAAYFPQLDGALDPEAPADLVPRSGQFPTERVQYTTLLLDQILRPAGAPPLVDATGPSFSPVDVAPVADAGFGFQTLALGALLTVNQSWFMQAVTLGHLLHSMALAPGESTRVAMVDWGRKVRAGQTEVVGETEDLAQETSHNRSISEVTAAVAQEAQAGFSHTESESTTMQAGASLGLSIGPVGFGASGSIANTTTSADSWATTAGRREIGASMLQQASDRTHQHAHAARTRRASVVREVSQSEHEQVSTRVVTNYNHMHALTVQYYEVLQVYRTETALAACDRVVFVPFKLVDFANEDVLRRFRGALVAAALTPAVRDALVNYDTIEVVPERRVRFPGLGATLDEAVLDVSLSRAPVLARRVGEVEPADGEAPAHPEPPVRPEPVVPDVPDVTRALWGDAARRVMTILGSGAVRRGSESLFVPSDVRLVDGRVDSTAGAAVTLVFHRADGSAVSDLSLSVPLAEIERITLTGGGATSAVEATATLTLARNGVVFPLELPTVTVERGASETPLVRLQAASADVNLVKHLGDNRLHYSQAVYRSLDAAMLAGLLAPYSIPVNGEPVPLVQVAEPAPLRIVGNMLAFKIATDPAHDEEWRAWMTERGLTLGQAKVDLVPLSSGGVFAEAVLGRFNSAEKLDLTRFWNWQDSPIPIQPTEIAAVETGSRATAENVAPGQLSAPLVGLTPPTALPEPAGMAATLAALQNGSMFRDMSGLSETVKLATEAIKASSGGATSAAQQAGKNMEVAVTADTERQRIAANLAAARAGKPLGDTSESAKGAAVNEVDKRAGNGRTGTTATGSGAPGAASRPGGGAGGAGAGMPPGGTGTAGVGGGGTAHTGAAVASSSTGNVALDQIVGNDDLLRRYVGMTDGSPAPTPAVTPEGVPTQEWDVIGTGYDEDRVGTPPHGATPLPDADLEQRLATEGTWVATRVEDLRPLLLGDQRRGASDLGVLLRALSLSPTGSIRALNLVLHATADHELAFGGVFTYDEVSGGLTGPAVQDPAPLAVLGLGDLLGVTGGGTVEVDGGVVALADVRSAFPVDGEVRVFNMTHAISSELVQAVANLFQVRATGFVRKPVRIVAEPVAASADPAAPPVLAKKVTVSELGTPAGPSAEFFTQLLDLDRAATGAFTAFPRR
ncbi:hypothetical protein [Georgenia thermotolerans]|uniref:Uncharacterized protein n=1 Tax=Georgenia thermotolerans TaxID=527326 RepID=A0A7J5UNT6_9MICO|nr:hypothetical protein [Georgenia thermotolerans]KAE8764007.1 hypothetical protein GB883_11110 [Georgenia thermotolerans]